MSEKKKHQRPWDDPEHDIMADLLAAKKLAEENYDRILSTPSLFARPVMPCTCFGHEYGDDPRCPLHYSDGQPNTATGGGS